MPTKRLILAASSALALAAASPAMATAAPANDDFAAAEVISGAEAPPAAYDLVGAGRQGGEPAIAGAGGTVWFSWTPASTGATFADVCGDDRSHHVQVHRAVSGGPDALGNLESARTGDSEPLPADSSCRMHWRAVAGETYFIQVAQDGDAYGGWLTVDQDPTAPDAPTIDASWPAITGPDHTAAFTGESGASFVCRLDQGAWASCSSPTALTGLARGAHQFDVRAVDAHGNLGAITTRIWAVEEPAAVGAPAETVAAEQPVVATQLPQAVVAAKPVTKTKRVNSKVKAKAKAKRQRKARRHAQRRARARRAARSV